jgi:hypothetical protein
LKPSIRTIELEIDTETRVIRRMVVRRVFNGEPFATVTCTLAETDALDPAKYQLEGHLTDPSMVPAARTGEMTTRLEAAPRSPDHRLTPPDRSWRR